MARCTATTADGSPCKSTGNEKTDGLCYPHWVQAKKGRKVNEVRLRCVETYKNGAIGIPGTGIGEEIVVTKPKWEQIMRDNPDAFVVISD